MTNFRVGEGLRASEYLVDKLVRSRAHVFLPKTFDLASDIMMCLVPNVESVASMEERVLQLSDTYQLFAQGHLLQLHLMDSAGGCEARQRDGC